MKVKYISKLNVEEEIAVEFPSYYREGDDIYYCICNENNMLRIFIIEDEIAHSSISTMRKDQRPDIDRIVATETPISEVDFSRAYIRALTYQRELLPEGLKKAFVAAFTEPVVYTGPSIAETLMGSHKAEEGGR